MTDGDVGLYDKNSVQHVRWVSSTGPAILKEGKFYPGLMNFLNLIFHPAKHLHHSFSELAFGKPKRDSRPALI